MTNDKFKKAFLAIDCAVQSPHMDCYSEHRDLDGFAVSRMGRSGGTVMLEVALWNEIKKRLKIK